MFYSIYCCFFLCLLPSVYFLCSSLYYFERDERALNPHMRHIPAIPCAAIVHVAKCTQWHCAHSNMTYLIEIIADKPLLILTLGFAHLLFLRQEHRQKYFFFYFFTLFFQNVYFGTVFLFIVYGWPYSWFYRKIYDTQHFVFVYTNCVGDDGQLDMQVL